MQRPFSTRCIQSLCALLTACSAPWLTPRTFYRKPSSVGWGPTAAEWVNPRRSCAARSRLCLDQLKSARRQRETYVGPWLPDPVLEEEDEEDVTLPLMLALERLSPLERAAFLLHDVFGQGFEEVAATIRRDPAACRQLAARARTHVREGRPRFQVEKQRGLELAKAFFNASRSGDMKALGAMLAADVSVHADGGGKRPAAMQPIFGFDAVMKVHEDLAAYFGRMAQNLFVQDRSTDCPVSSRWRPMENFRRPRSKSRTKRWPQSMWCETPTS